MADLGHYLFGLLIICLGVAFDCIAFLLSFRYCYVHLRSITEIKVVGYCVCRHSRYGTERWSLMIVFFQR